MGGGEESRRNEGEERDEVMSLWRSRRGRWGQRYPNNTDTDVPVLTIAVILGLPNAEIISSQCSLTMICNN